jgi:hypothetical protein
VSLISGRPAPPGAFDKTVTRVGKDSRAAVQPLSVRLIAGGVLYPTIRVASRPGRLLMGVYDDRGSYVEDTVLDRRAGEQGAPVPRDLFPVVTDSAAPGAIYAGPLYFHFGHFLLESLARSWYTRRHPDLPLVWAGQHDWQTVQLRPWQTEILDILEIRNPTGIAADPTRFPVLHVPDIGYRYDDRFHPEHAEFLARYRGPDQARGSRLWVSRSKIGSDARNLNSEATERRLADAGWTIAYPELLTVREQLDHLCRAEVVAGEEGSAFHTAMLLRDVSSKRFRVFRRHGAEHGNMRTVGDARGLDQTFYSLERQRVVRADGRFVAKVTPNASEILDLLDVPVPVVPEVGATAAEVVLARTIAELAPRRFLEVGSTRPRLALGSGAESRVAVSPRFDVDPRSHAGSPVDFYELGLQQYAELFHHGDPFDAISVSGPGFTAITEAFHVSRRLAHPGTIWVLGTGQPAARAALAVRLTYAGFRVRRLLVGRASVYLAQRIPGAPTNVAGVGQLSAEEVRRRLRWLRPVGIASLRRRRTRGPT